MSSDKYCWICLKDSNLIARCTNCFRSYHLNCGKYSSNIPWVCPVCLTIAKKTRISSKDGGKELTELLHFAWEQMMSSADALNMPEDKVDMPEDQLKYTKYDEYIGNPLKEIKFFMINNKYQCTEALLADIKRIYNNCVYFHETKLVPLAKEIVKICKQEIKEIDTCKECYRNSKTIKDWFTEVHTTPHLLLWAKVKTFPYWPAKVMFVKPNLVSVTFFGQHEHACVPFNDCYLYSEKDPNLMIPKSKRNDFTDSIKEIDIYIKNIIQKFGSFNYSDFKTNFEPKNIKNHLKAMIPNYNNKTSSSDDPKPPTNAVTDDIENNIIANQINRDGGQSVIMKTNNNDILKYLNLISVQQNESNVSPASIKKSSTTDQTKAKIISIPMITRTTTKSINRKRTIDNQVKNESKSKINKKSKSSRKSVVKPIAASAPVNSSNTVKNMTTNTNVKTPKSTTNTTTKTTIDLIPTCDIKIEVDEQTPIEKNVSEKDNDLLAAENKIKLLELEITRLNFELKESKKKQWCANCSAEATFYCCWNTSYCKDVCRCLHSQHQVNCKRRDNFTEMDVSAAAPKVPITSTTTPCDKQ